LATMRHAFSHSYLGVFGRVITSGTVQCGDKVSLIAD
jgi:MOSC domain-containing protein YiiM